MQGHRHVLPLKSEVISSLRSSLSTPSLSQCIEELVFNSLDARATCIAVRVDLENYRIQVVDNGCGIVSSDLTLVGQQYATSKCYGLEDLNTLAFFGFRGEFLASLSNISSVLEVISRPKGTKTTFSKLFQKGEVYEISEAKERRPSHGSTVTAYNVFYNLPVRQKKISVALDLEKIRKRLEAFAIIHHNVSFSLRDDLSGSKIFQTHNTLSPKSAFGFLFGHPKANNLKEIANSYRNFSVSGYLGTEGHANKNLQYIYVNKQLVLKTKLHKLVNHFLSRSLLLKPSKFGKSPDSPITLDSSSHCQQSSPPKGQGENAVFILDIKCLRSEYDIQYDNHKTFLEFQDWKGVSICLEQALQQFLVNENLCLISEEGKATKKKDEAFVEDSSEESLSEGEEELSQPPPAQLAKLQKYGYNISTRNCTNNLQSRVVTRAHLRGKTKTNSEDKKEHKANNNIANESVDSEDLEEAPTKFKTNSDSGELHSSNLLLLNDDESFTDNTKEIQQCTDTVQTNLPQKDEETMKAEAEEERDSRVLIPEVSSYSKSTIQEDSESIPLIMPSCASTLSAGGESSLKISEDRCMDKQTLGQETTLLSQDDCAGDGHNKISEKGRQLQEKNAGNVSCLYAHEILALVDSASCCNSRKGPVKCGPTMSSASSRSISVTAARDKVIPATTRGEVSFGFEQVGGSSTEDNFNLSKEDSNQESLSEAKAAVNEEDTCMVICKADSHKSHSPVPVKKSVQFESLEGSNQNSYIQKVPLSQKKHEVGRSNDSVQDTETKPQRKECSQDENTAGIEIQETSTYTSSLQRFKNGLKSRPVNVASNLAAKISDALNKAKAQNAIFCTNSTNRDTTSHLSRMRSHFFPVTENNLPVDIRDAPSIRLSQKLAWLKKCKPSEKADNFTKLKEDSPSLEQSLVKDFYSERKTLSGIQRKGTSEYKEIVGCQRRQKLDEISDVCISQTSVSSRTSSKQMNRSETLLGGRNMLCRIENCSCSDLTSLSSECSPCQSNSGKDVEAPVFSDQRQIYSGHFTQESSDSLLVNRALPKCFEVHGDLQEKPVFKHTNSTTETNLDCRLCNYGFMSTESFIQPARDLLPCKNQPSANVSEDLLATCSCKDFVDKSEINKGNFVDGVEEDMFQDHQKYFDRGLSVSSEEIMLAKSYTSQQSSCKVATSEDNGNSLIGSMASSDVKAISEARHKEILSMIDNPSLLSPEKEKQVNNDMFSPLISDRGNEVPFSSYKDSPFKEIPSTQPFHVQNSPVEGVKDSERQIETFGQFTSQKEDNEEEDKSLKMGHVSPSEPCELQIVENEKRLNTFSELLPTIQGEELTSSSKDKQSSEKRNGERSPCHMGMNWNMYDEDNTDLLTVLKEPSKPHASKIRSDVENKLLFCGKDTQLQTDEVVTDVIEREGPLNDGKVTSLQGGEPCLYSLDTVRKDDFKITDRSEASTRVILREDHTIALEKTNFEHPLQQNMISNESKKSDGHLETSTEKTVEAGVHYQKECDSPSQQNPAREKVAQPCSTEVSSTTEGQGLGSTVNTLAMKKVSNPVPWELYWFLPKTAKAFFPRPLQDRHPAPEKTASLQSAHLLDEFLKEENETAALQSKWKYGIPHIEKEDCRSFDELFDNWQNPVFKTNDADVPDSSATRSISATVKVHNSLHPYQFTKEIFETIEIIGQLDKKFIVCLVSTSGQKRTERKPHLLVLIDQHAAHERIRLEQLTQDAYVSSNDDSDSEDTSSCYLQDTTVPYLRSCRVIPPIPINITDEECRLAQAFSQKLKRFGVTVSISKRRKDYRAEVTELPACMVEREANMVKKARQTVAADLAEALVQESILQLQDAAGSCASLPRTISKILNSQACRGAIKFGDPLTLDDILSLLSQLSECNLPFQCAHGRPSIIPLLDFNHLTSKLHSQDSHSHHPQVNLKRFMRKRIEMVDGDKTKT